MARSSVTAEDEQRPTTSPLSAILKAVIALAVFGLSFVLFLIAPLALIVAVCLALVWQERRLRRAKTPARQPPAAPARTPRGPVDEIDASFRFGGQVKEHE